VSTDGAATASPFLKTVAVEDVLAGDGEKAGCVVHSLEADGTCWELDEVWRWWREWLQEGC
jgi:hypothetical protein